MSRRLPRSDPARTAERDAELRAAHEAALSAARLGLIPAHAATRIAVARASNVTPRRLSRAIGPYAPDPFPVAQPEAATVSSFLESPKATDRPSNLKAGPFGRPVTDDEYAALIELRRAIGDELIKVDAATIDLVETRFESADIRRIVRAVRQVFVGEDGPAWAILVNHPTSPDSALVARLDNRIALSARCAARWRAEALAARWIAANPDFKVGPRLRLENCNPRPVAVATLNQPGA